MARAKKSNDKVQLGRTRCSLSKCTEYYANWREAAKVNLGTEPGKVRPVVVVQTDALNRVHPSTVVCPLTTKTAGFENPLRVALPKAVAGLSRASDVLVDQIKSSRSTIVGCGASSARYRIRICVSCGRKFC
jgi:mRNA-degrading endonuclease toxin of MazEF toxin-antitoxin module